MNSFYKESIEFQEVAVSVDDQPSGGFELSLLPVGQRPTDLDWGPTTVIEGREGLLLQDLEAGEYAVWVRVQDLPEKPVLYAGRISIV